MDILRAVIVGAEGTPYHDGLFFFDVFFPSGYPSVPPVCHCSFFLSFFFGGIIILLLGISLCDDLNFPSASLCTITLVAFDSIQICMHVVRFVSVFLTPGLVRRMRSGFLLCQPCCKFWSLYRH